MRAWCIAAVIVAAATVVVMADESGCGLRCVLEAWPWPLPDESERIRSVVCDGALIGAVKTQQFPASVGLAMSVAAEGLASQSCSFVLADDNATHSATLNATRLEFVFALEGDPPRRASISNCSAIVEASAEVPQSAVEELSEAAARSLCAMLSDAADSFSASLADLADTIAKYSSAQPPPSDNPPAPECANNLAESAVVNVLASVLDDDAGPSAVSGLLQRVTNNTGARSTNVSGQAAGILGGYVPLGQSDCFYGVQWLDFAGISNWTAFDPLEVEPSLDNQTVIASAGLARMTLGATWNVDIAARTPDGEDIGTFSQIGHLELHLANPSLRALTRLFVNSTALTSLSLSQLTDWRCLLRSLLSADVQQAELNVSGVDSAVFSFSSSDDGDIEEDLLAAVNDAAALLSRAYKPFVVGLANGVWVPSVLGPLRMLLISVLGNDWPCNATEPAPERPMIGWNWAIPAIAIASGLYLVLFVTAVAVSCMQRKQQQQPAASLMLNPKINVAVRYLVPFVLFANAAMFVTSTASIGAAVLPIIRLGTHEIDLPSVFNFGLANTINDMWKAGVIPLALLVAVFSGAWPYGKLLLMLLCWVLPPAGLGVSKRETLLRALDALSKWSLVDIFCLVLFAVAFRFHVVFDSRPGLLAPGSTIDLFVVSKAGFVLFVLATVLSLVVGHLIIAIHRHVERPRAAAGETDSLLSSELSGSAEKPIPLFSLAFRGEGVKPAVFRTLVPVALLASIGLVVAGIVAQCVRFEIKGAAGWALSVIGQNPPRAYSLLDVGREFLESSTDPTGFSTMLIEIVFMATAVVVPLFHLAVLLFLWLCPLRAKAQSRVFVLAEVLNAWSAIEVFTLSILAALLQIRQFTQFMVSGHCDAIAPLLSEYLGTDSCFDVVATIGHGSWLLLAGCITYVAAAMVVMHHCHSALQKRNGLHQHQPAPAPPAAAKIN